MSKERSPYKVLRPLGIDGRREKGEVVYLTADAAKAYSTEDLIPYTPEATPREAAVEKDLSELSLAELKEKASKLGLKTGGSKADLVERIQLAADSSGTSEEEGAETTTEEESSEEGN